MTSVLNNGTDGICRPTKLVFETIFLTISIFRMFGKIFWYENILFKTRNLIYIFLQNVQRNSVRMKQKHCHKFFKLFCKDHNLNDLGCAIIIAHHKRDNQTYAIESVDIYRQSLSLSIHNTFGQSWSSIVILWCGGKNLLVVWLWLHNGLCVFHLIWTQEWGYCDLDLGLLKSQRASMWPQDWAEITFRSEIL